MQLAIRYIRAGYSRILFGKLTSWILELVLETAAITTLTIHHARNEGQVFIASLEKGVLYHLWMITLVFHSICLCLQNSRSMGFILKVTMR